MIIVSMSIDSPVMRSSNIIKSTVCPCIPLDFGLNITEILEETINVHNMTF